MRKILVGILLYGVFSFIFLKAAYGVSVAGESARLKGQTKPTITLRLDTRPLKLASYLRAKNSLLEDKASFMIKVADKYKIDYRLFPAIAGVESGFCKAYIVSTNNCVGWGGGYIPFKSIDSQIETILKALRERYVNDGLTSVDLIGRRWAEDPNWSYKVKSYMKEIDGEELSQIERQEG